MSASPILTSKARGDVPISGIGAGVVALAVLCVMPICPAAAWGQSSSSAKSDAAQANDLKLGPLEISGNWHTGRPSGGNRSFANVWDLSGGYEVTQGFSVGLYYAHAWGKEVIRVFIPKIATLNLRSSRPIFSSGTAGS